MCCVTLAQFLTEERAANEEEVGGCVSEADQAFRFATARTLMGCGIPFNKLDKGLKSLLQRCAASSIGNTSDLKRAYIPLVRKHEYDTLKCELEGQWLNVIFDGTTRCGEVLAVVVRFCTEDFEIVHRLIALRTAAKHMTGAQLSAMIVRILIHSVGVDALDRVISCTRDSCATNGAALTALKSGAMPSLFDVLCFAHTLHNCAKHMDLKVLESWLTPWFHLMSHSHAAKSRWRTMIDTAPKLFSKVRWWSRLECATELGTFFGLIEQFLDDLQKEKIAEATTTALVQLWSDEATRLDLELDLAVMLDAICFCNSTYRLEGDRLEILLVYDEIEAIRTKGCMLQENMSMLPNVAALLRGRVCFTAYAYWSILHHTHRPSLSISLSSFQLTPPHLHRCESKLERRLMNGLAHPTTNGTTARSPSCPPSQNLTSLR